MPAPDAILRLIEQFGSDIASYKSPSYNETQVRIDFINPLFDALGWATAATPGSRQAYREVVHEGRLHTAQGGASKAPDYCFYLGGARKFFVEAKKPSVNLDRDPAPAVQLRRYGWSAKLPISIVTDFEELAVYDCRLEPAVNDTARVGRLLYIPYTEYETEWDTISALFSRQAVLDGSLDRFIDEHKPARAANTVDSAFLKEISSWRDSLARNIADRNPTLSQGQLNFAVQMTIDRILFLRICEARGLESRESMDELREVANIYPRLCNLFQDADDRYNSGLFHFKKERGRDEPDDLTLTLWIGDETLRDIFRRLYPPYSPYAFDVMPIEILGQVYEQFLGKVIRLEQKDKQLIAVIEEKPEVRKAGGVYYTPTYIVDYIVKETVGRALQGKTPAQAANLRILDPACGSGSFLIGAYNYLLEWHLEWYVREGHDKHRRKLAPLPDGRYKLGIEERKRILLNNIYGVDIDSQAVEVTKLSLLLKVLEGETERTLAVQKSAFHERVLPDLDKNIKCGNSLISYDFYDTAQAASLTQEERARINVFDWQGEFPQIMQAGGFDVVIGNPPYLNIRILTQVQGEQVKGYFRLKYLCAQRGYDLYVLFVERAFKCLCENGIFGMIIPNKIATLDYAEACRAMLLAKTRILRLADVSELRVFENASVYPYILIFAKELPDLDHHILLAHPKSPSQLNESDHILTIRQDTLSPQQGLTIHGTIEIEARVPTRRLSECAALHSGTTGFAAQEVAQQLVEHNHENEIDGFDFVVSGNIDRYAIRLGNVRCSIHEAYIHKTCATQERYANR